MKTETQKELEEYKEKLTKEAKQRIINKRRIKIFYFTMFTIFVFFVCFFLLLDHKDKNFEDISKSSELILLSVLTVSFIFIIIEIIVMIYASRFVIKKERLLKELYALKSEKLTTLRRDDAESEKQFSIIKQKFEDQHIKNWKEIHLLEQISTKELK